MFLPGSSVRILWQWDDGTEDDYYHGHLNNFVESDRIGMRHRFVTAGDRVVNVTISNNFDVYNQTYFVRVFNAVSYTILGQSYILRP